jgi:ABC-2 type transport system ATP-binding protein
VTAGPAARLEAVSRRFGRHVALAEATFAVEPGQVLGLLGPNGAGKTTTMRLLTGYLRPTTGRVTVGGLDIATREAKQLVGYMPESVSLPPHFRVSNYLASCARVRGLARASRATEVERVAEVTALAEVMGKPVGALSHGYAKRVALAQALLGDPPVLILDEPTTGMDPRQVALARTLIGRLGRRHAVLLSSHLLSEVSQLCRQVVVLDHGSVIASGPVDDLSRGQRRIVMRMADADGCVTVVRAVVGVDRVERRDNLVMVWGERADLTAALSKAVVDAGMSLLELRVESSTLEDAYLRLVGE